MNINKLLIATFVGLSFPLLITAAPFGNTDDVVDAKKVWQASLDAGFVGENSIVTRPYKGMPPHGMILELMEKNVTINGHKGALVIKRDLCTSRMTSKNG